MTKSLSRDVHGILLSAGEGRRLLPLTKRTHKSLLITKGRPIIDYTLAALRNASISNVSVVVHSHSRQIVEHLQSKNINFEVIRQETLDGTGGALLAFAKHQAMHTEESKSFLISATDYLVPENIYSVMVNAQMSTTADIVVCASFTDPSKVSKASLAKIDERRNLQRIVQKPKNFDRQNELLTTKCIYLFTFETLLQARSILEKNIIEVPHVINRLIECGSKAVVTICSDFTDADEQFSHIYKEPI